MYGLEGLLCVTVPIGLVILAIVLKRDSGRGRVDLLESELNDLRQSHRFLFTRVSALERKLEEATARAVAPAQADAAVHMPVAPPAAAPSTVVAEPVAPFAEEAPVVAPEAPSPAAEGIAATPAPSSWAPGSAAQSPAHLELPTSSSIGTDDDEMSPAASRAVDWERWLGVRGAAVLGGIVMALAGLTFFRYSIEHNLIPPPMRVAMGVAAGLGCLYGGQRLRARYVPTANGLAAAGIVILYAAFWAARVLYDLVPMPVAFVFMALTTAVSCLLAIRHGSRVITVIGIAGGFATPLLLSTGSNQPFGLFGYVLLLDLGFLQVARRRSWSWLPALLLGSTALMQFLWIVHRMESDQLVIALAVLGLFALLFARQSVRDDGDADARWMQVRTAATSVLLPFLFALYFAGRGDLGAHLYPLAMLMGLLSVAAGVLADRQQTPMLSMGTSAGSVAVVLRYVASRDLSPALYWELAFCAFALAAVPHFFVERRRDVAGADGPAAAAMIAGIGLLTVFGVTAMERTAGIWWPVLVGWLLLAALLVRHGTLSNRSWLLIATSSLLAVLVTGFEVRQAGSSLGEDGYPSSEAFLLINSAFAVAFQLLAVTRRFDVARSNAEHAAALMPIAWVLAVRWTWPDPQNAILWHGVTFGWAYLAVLVATRIPSGAWFGAAVVALAVVHSGWTIPSCPSPVTALVLQGLCVVFFLAWPLLHYRTFQREPLAMYASALAAPGWFFSLRSAWEGAWGNAAIGLLPVLLAAATLTGFAHVQRTLDAATPDRKNTLALFAAVVLGFVSVAIPLQLDEQWITLGWALEGLAVIALWTRLDHSGLKYFGLALHAVVFVRLTFNSAVLGYESRSTWRIVNWLMYVYWVPVATQVWSAILLRRDEVARARPWEGYLTRVAVGAAGCGLGAVLLFFIWINLAIADWFSTGEAVTLSFERLPARDLATSLAWGAYALVLLAIGVWRSLSALRWLSLAFLILTIGKVFLYDVAHLKDLYRVMSLVGLALSLIGVSLAYQKFVFRKPRRPPSP